MELLNAEQFGYVAGLIDAECSIQINKRQHRSVVKDKEYIYKGYSLYLDMSNTSKDLILWCVENIGGSWGNKSNPHPEKWKQAYYWKISGKDAQKLLKKVIHLLIEKRERALLAMNFPLKHHKRDREYKENLYLKMKELNQRGIINKTCND